MPYQIKRSEAELKKILHEEFGVSNKATPVEALATLMESFDWQDKPYAKDVAWYVVRQQSHKHPSENIISAKFLRDNKLAGQSDLAELIDPIIADGKKNPELALIYAQTLSAIGVAPDSAIRELRQASSKADQSEVLGMLSKVADMMIYSDDKERFQLMKGLDERSLFTLASMTYSNITPSTFDYVMTNIGKQDLYAMAEKSGNLDKLPTFIEAANTTGRADKVWANIGKDNVDDIADMMIRNVGAKGQKLEGAIILADTMQNLKDKNSREIFEDRLADAYSKASGDEKKKLGLAAKYYVAGNDIISDNSKTQAAFTEVSGNKKYSGVQNNGRSTDEALFNNNPHSKICYQMQLFYNDTDGVDSFKNFTEKFKADGWKFEDKGSYVITSKTANTPDGPREIKMYSVKPHEDPNLEQGKIHKLPAVTDIKADIAKEQGHSAKFDMIIHRGHSYHTNSTIALIDKDTNIVFMGSCSGRAEKDAIKKKAPHTQVISTDGEGAMDVNDPMLLATNKEILRGKGMVWRDAWDQGMSGTSNQSKNYRRPDESSREYIEANYRKGLFGNIDLDQLPKLPEQPDQQKQQAPAANLAGLGVKMVENPSVPGAGNTGPNGPGASRTV